MGRDHDNVQSAYGGGARPAPAAGAVDNALIFVHGDTATSQVIYTEYRPEMKGDPVKMTVQGKEFATWVKVRGQWLYKERYVGLSEPPAGWKE